MVLTRRLCWVLLAIAYMSGSNAHSEINSLKCRNVCVGETVVLDCYLYDTPVTSVGWHADHDWPEPRGSRIEEWTDERRNWIRPEKNPTNSRGHVVGHHLRLSNVSKEDDGRYRCREDRRLVYETYLNVHECPIEILVILTANGKPKSRRVPIDDYYPGVANIVFPEEEKTTGEIKLECRWVSANSEDDSMHYRPTTTEVFNNISDYDGDVFARCSVRFNHTVYESEVRFTAATKTENAVDAELPSPRISTHCVEVACASAEISVFCSVSNAPEAAINWTTNNDVELQQLTHSRRNVVGSSSKLHEPGEFVVYHEVRLENISKAHEGSYWCSADTANRTLKTKTELKVIECPLEIVATLTSGGKTKSTRMNTSDFVEGISNVAFPDEAKTSQETSLSCSVVSSGSDIPLASSRETFSNISSIDGVVYAYCAVTYLGIEYHVDAEFH